MSCSPCIIVHGGVEDETVKHSLIVERVASCKKSACIGFEKMLSGGSAMDAVEAALRWLEDDELFNCGYGSVLNNAGKVQTDASIVNGLTLECGSVVAVSGVDHPISLARYVLENSPNVILCEEKAAKLAKKIPGVVTVSNDVNITSPGARLTSTTDDYEKQIYPNKDIVAAENCTEETVGCIAWDGTRLCVGSSSGGTRCKLEGRLNGSGLLGCSVFADERFGCSLTAPAESAITLHLARRLVKNYETRSLQEGLEQLSAGLTIGAVGLDNKGEFSVHFTAGRMPYCYASKDRVVSGSELSKCNDVGAE